MTKIAGRGADLLAALRGKPDQWLTRADLAELTGKNQLSPNDRHWLDRLEREGLIEVQQRTKPEAVIGYEYVYRAMGVE